MSFHKNKQQILLLPHKEQQFLLSQQQHQQNQQSQRDNQGYQRSSSFNSMLQNQQHTKASNLKINQHYNYIYLKRPNLTISRDSIQTGQGHSSVSSNLNVQRNPFNQLDLSQLKGQEQQRETNPNSDTSQNFSFNISSSHKRNSQLAEDSFQQSQKSDDNNQRNEFQSQQMNTQSRQGQRNSYQISSKVEKFALRQSTMEGLRLLQQYKGENEIFNQILRQSTPQHQRSIKSNNSPSIFEALSSQQFNQKSENQRQKYQSSFNSRQGEQILQSQQRATTQTQRSRGPQNVENSCQCELYKVELSLLRNKMKLDKECYDRQLKSYQEQIAILNQENIKFEQDQKVINQVEIKKTEKQEKELNAKIEQMSKEFNVNLEFMKKDHAIEIKKERKHQKDIENQLNIYIEQMREENSQLKNQLRSKQDVIYLKIQELEKEYEKKVNSQYSRFKEEKLQDTKEIMDLKRKITNLQNNI